MIPPIPTSGPAKLAQKTKTVDMTTVQKFIISGDWNVDVNHERLVDLKVNFHTPYRLPNLQKTILRLN